MGQNVKYRVIIEVLACDNLRVLFLNIEQQLNVKSLFNLRILICRNTVFDLLNACTSFL